MDMPTRVSLFLFYFMSEHVYVQVAMIEAHIFP